MAVRSNHGKVWSLVDIRRLQALMRRKTPVAVIALTLGRTKDAIYKKYETL